MLRFGFANTRYAEHQVFPIRKGFLSTRYQYFARHRRPHPFDAVEFGFAGLINFKRKYTQVGAN